MKHECRKCKHARVVPGVPLVGCSNPDNQVVGLPSAVHDGRWRYPIRFDPACMRNGCRNFEARPPITEGDTMATIKRQRASIVPPPPPPVRIERSK